MKKIILPMAVCLGLFILTGNAAGKPGDGIQPVEAVVIHPFVEVAYSYDTNPRLLPIGQEQEDSFWDLSPGMNISRARENIRMEGLFWGRLRRFDTFTDKDVDDWSEEMRLTLGRRENWNLKLHERYGRVSDYDLSVRTMDVAAEGTGDRYLETPEAAPLSVMERTERVDRYLLDCGIGVGGPLTEKTYLDGLVDYGLVDYIPAELYDSTEQKASLKAARSVTDKSSAVLVGEFIQMENDSLSDPAYYYAGRLGWRWQGTFKSRFEGSAGYYGFDAKQPDSLPSLRRDGPAYDLAWYWQARPKLSVSLGGRSEMQLAPDTAKNAKLVDMITGSVNYSATQRLSLTLLVGYRHENFSEGEELSQGALVRRVVEQIHGRVHADYQVFKWLKGYGELWLEDTTDNVRGDYKETRATLGVKAMY
ncbi:MAG: hypothetical protein WCO77_07900 [bacterium]